MSNLASSQVSQNLSQSTGQPSLQPRDFSSSTSNSQQHTPIPVYKGNPFRPAPGMPIPERIKVAFEKLKVQVSTSTDIGRQN